MEEEESSRLNRMKCGGWKESFAMLSSHQNTSTLRDFSHTSHALTSVITRLANASLKAIYANAMRPDGDAFIVFALQTRSVRAQRLSRRPCWCDRITPTLWNADMTNPPTPPSQTFVSDHKVTVMTGTEVRSISSHSVCKIPVISAAHTPSWAYCTCQITSVHLSSVFLCSCSLSFFSPPSQSLSFKYIWIWFSSPEPENSL